MPRFDLPIVFCEQEASPPILESIHGGGASNIQTNSTTSTNKDGNGPSNTNAGTLNQDRSNTIDSSLFTIVDPEIARDNPVEAKHRRLVRSHRSGPLDRELKPNAAVRDELNVSSSKPILSFSNWKAYDDEIKSDLDPLRYVDTLRISTLSILNLRRFSLILRLEYSVRQKRIGSGLSDST